MCRFQRNRTHVASVGAAIMSREVLPRLHLYLLPFLLFSLRKASSHVLPGDCLEFDVNELEDYLSELDLENVPTIGMMVGQFQCPVTTLPFGALRSDWARLLLLQRAQPEGSILREKLARLFRVLVIAYFQMEERFDATRSMPAITSSANALSTYGSTGAVSSEGRTEGAEVLRSSATDSRETNEISESFIPSAARGGSIDAAEIQSTAFTSWNFAGGDGDASDGMLNDVSSTTDVSSPVGGRIDAAGTVEPFVTASSGVITFSSVSAGKSAETSDNYLDNEAVDGGSSRTDEPATPRTEEEISGDRGNNFQEEVQSTTVDSKGERSRYRECLTTAFVEKDIKKTVGRGDSPILDDSMDAEDEEENMVAEEGGGSSFSKFANTSSAEIPEVKIATESGREISENHVAGSAETFTANHRENILQVSKKTAWSLVTSTTYPNKIGKASISRKPPLDDEFWKYTVTTRSVTPAVVTSSSTWKLPDRPKVRNGLTRGPVKSKKRGSLNTNMEKNFRWFYNVGREDKEHARGASQGIHIECNGQGYEN
ncbi:LOW QUALITY PROTEIN: uncharacterized protein LOC143367998 [Andrena cerasifolii]|uniref:LOW QUALITY PROTEIN: uncharacterized protein LOC143367998 n=1 Tax=Andrena cerasifolii TaxID=2819439 RepID=UPI004038139D